MLLQFIHLASGTQRKISLRATANPVSSLAWNLYNIRFKVTFNSLDLSTRNSPDTILHQWKPRLCPFVRTSVFRSLSWNKHNAGWWWWFVGWIFTLKPLRTLWAGGWWFNTRTLKGQQHHICQTSIHSSIHPQEGGWSLSQGEEKKLEFKLSPVYHTFLIYLPRCGSTQTSQHWQSVFLLLAV